MKITFLILFLLISSFIKSATITKEAPKRSNIRKLVLTNFKFRTSILRRMNQAREKHHAGLLSWDNQLAEKAKKNVTAIKENPDAEVETNAGETIYLYYESKYIDVNNIVEAWEEEEEKYNYKKPGFQMEASMFTQLVWKESTKVGCAFSSEITDEGDYQNIAICLFNPKGNIDRGNNEYAENVLPENLNQNEEDEDDSMTYEQYMEKIYEKINFYRNEHKAKALSRSITLEEKAYELAKEAVKTGKVPKSNDYGINFVGSEEELADPEYVVDYMYKYKKYFNFKNTEFSDDAPLFMQLIWKSSEEVGCGMEQDTKNNRFVYICLFDPKMEFSSKQDIIDNVYPILRLKPKTNLGFIKHIRKDKFHKRNEEIDEDEDEENEKDDNVIIHFTEKWKLLILVGSTMLIRLIMSHQNV